jgi:Kef-type K+ transport system membrane component KefB
MITSELLINLFLILVVAWLLGGVFARFGLPRIMGALLAGFILGPPLLGIIRSSPALEFIAELGIFFVMLYTGLELDPKELLEHIRPSLAVALGGFILPFILGYYTTRIFGGTVYQSLFVGIGISITAIAVQSVILHSLRIQKTYLGHIIIGAAIADDIFSLMALSVLLGLAKTGEIQVLNIFWMVLKVCAFFGFTIILGQFVIPKFTRKLYDHSGKAFTFTIVSALAMAYLADLAGLHFIIGAFLAGQFTRKEIVDKKIYDAINDRFLALSYGFLVPVFFASLSFHLHLYWERSFIFLSIAITVTAIIGKLIGSGLGLAVFRRNIWESAIVGFGMNGRGAVELVVASVILKLSNDLLASGAFITTLMAPFTLRWSILKTCRPDEKAAFCSLWDES